MNLFDKLSKEELTNIAKSSYSLASMLEIIGYRNNGAVSKMLREYLDKYQIDYSHFSRKPHTKRTPENIFIKDSDASQKVLREYYLKGKYSLYVCSICNSDPIWRGKDLSLRLDHINGINNDDRLENLRWVCPNCDSQLNTYGSKNQAYKIK